MARCDITDLIVEECGHCAKLPSLPLASDFVPGRKSTGTVVPMPSAAEGLRSKDGGFTNKNRVRVTRPSQAMRNELHKARTLNKGFAIEAHAAFLEKRIAEWDARIEAAVEGGADKEQVRLARAYVRVQREQLKKLA